ncbi:NADPH-cytochrome [Zancudomyces culisetae]|uniref:NADPH--hemoprotein reductase n=1 Tax=Zancudomyces culisetae TaxID=1213189 RepID=A0A1R1PIR6_ZANCU|nr:NADPH-cytochrome [Zancudomyces culisetae]|eukprot:OMH80905.1 NADPH-cytochrome [Zancudomyces culisetae]
MNIESRASKREVQYKFGSIDPVDFSYEESNETTLTAILLSAAAAISKIVEIVIGDKQKQPEFIKGGKEEKETKQAKMGRFEGIDGIVIATLLVGAATFILRRFLKGNSENVGGYGGVSLGGKGEVARNGEGSGKGVGRKVMNTDRDVAEVLRENKKNVAIMYGSQTGTAEDLGKRLAQEGELGFGLDMMVMDPDMYSVETLSKLDKKQLLVLVLATTGEGEACDNMAPWFGQLVGEDLFTEDFEDAEQIEFEHPEDGEFDEERPLANLRIAAFGLGNTTYEHYNWCIRQTVRRLQSLGAQLVGPLGLGDDDGDLENDFEEWKKVALPEICKAIGVDSTAPKRTYESTYVVKELDIDKAKDRDDVGKLAIGSGAPAIYDSSNVYEAVVTAAYDLAVPSRDRKFIHVDLALPESSKMTYKTGDHVGVYPANSEEAVNELLQVLKLQPETKIAVVNRADPTKPCSLVPHSPSTYASVLRHYLDITMPIPRSSIKYILLPHAHCDAAINYLTRLADDNDYYHLQISDPYKSPAELLAHIISIETSADPSYTPVFSFDLLFDLLPKLSPRFYSISSSSLVHPSTVSITASVLLYSNSDNVQRFGTTTNNFNVLKTVLSDRDSYTSPSPYSASLLSSITNSHSDPYLIHGFNTSLRISPDNQFKLPIYIRPSPFKLPTDPSIPIIMVGPGTGLAPFRAFIHERSLQSRSGSSVGSTILFFGNRNKDADFLYQDELSLLIDQINLNSPSNPNSMLITAFSRDQPQKVYVQHRIAEHKDMVYDLLFNRGAYFYICGDAKFMVKDVVNCIIDCLAEKRAIDRDSATDIFNRFRESDQYYEDVWS